MVKTRSELIEKAITRLAELQAQGLTLGNTTEFLEQFYEDVMWQVNKELKDHKNRRGW